MRYTAKQNLLKKGSHSLQGFVCEIASWTGHSNGCIVTLQLTHIDHQSASGRLKCFLYTPFTAPIGSYVCVYRFSLPITTEQKSSLELYALRDHLLGNYYGPHIKIKILPITTLSTLWAAWWYTWRENLYKKLQTMLPQKTFSYFSSLFLGNKHCDDYTTMRLYFTRWGLTHYLARSGLHISILTSLWIAALTLLPLTHSLKAIILGSVLMLYNYLSWQSISFNRALWIWLLYVGSWLTSTYATPLVALCNITLLILLYNPWYALCADFQLSFFLTAVLMLLSYRREQSFLLSSCIAKKK
jgi:predicted membrane metal-binding protein